MSDGRTTSLSSRLAKLGFSDVAAAQRLLSPSGPNGAQVPALALPTLARAADPDLALTGLRRVLDARPSAALLADVVEDGDALSRLAAVLGASSALADHLARHPDDLDVFLAGDLAAPRPTAAALRADLLHAVDADPAEPAPASRQPHLSALDALRARYRRLLLSVSARDLVLGLSVEDVAAELADLAGAALDAALAIARTQVPGSDGVRMAVIGLGKLGGRELNYVSDVDVVYVVAPAAGIAEERAVQLGQALAGALARACSDVTAEGSLWPVDAALRPEGKAGPLVRTLDSHAAYYERWAKTWEFQALIKARCVAGDAALGRQYGERIGRLVWQAADHPGFVDDVQAMRRRVEEHVPQDQRGRELKLGPGGLRDVEFSVQLLQLVHGRADVAVRSPTTLSALTALSVGGYVGRDDAASLAAAYRFLRTLEHRVQLYRLTRTHVVPDAFRDRRRIARSMGMRTDPVGELDAAWRDHAREARRLHEKLFYRPLLRAVTTLAPGDVRLAPDAARARLEVLGFADPAGALRHLTALTSGVSRRATIQSTLLPVMLGWFADSADADAGLLAFRQVSEALGTTHWYLALLRDGGASAERLARLLASSRYSSDLLLRAPEAVAMLADDDELRPRSLMALSGEMLATVRRSNDVDAAGAAVRGVRRRELFRISCADTLGVLDVEDVGPGLSTVIQASLVGALDAAVATVTADAGPLPTRVAVIGMGRLGGEEAGYASDADVLFVHDPLPDADERSATDAATAVANELRHLLGAPAVDPPLVVDADLRPEGRNGPLVRSLSSYAAYYQRWASMWERHALLRARPVAGDESLGSQFLALVDPLRYPSNGLTADELREIRTLKARMESERLPRGADPSAHLKLGPGGLADVEWTAQLLQLRHAHEVAQLRTTKTTSALRAAAEADLLDRDDAETLLHAWREASRLRDAVVLVRGRGDDMVPRELREVVAVSRLLGHEAGQASQLLETHRRLARRARVVVERVFYR